MAVRKQNIFNTITGGIRMGLFWFMVVVQTPIILLLPRGRVSVAYMRVFMWFLQVISSVKVRVHGKLVKDRPLLVVSNHISVFEIAMFPVAFGGSLIAKKEVASWPIVGWVAKKFGVIFVDRNPSTATTALNTVQKTLATIKYPLFVFPEGTTTNGAYVKPFKSALFNVIEGTDIPVQPVVVNYRFRNGDVISPEDMANHYAYFSNAKMDMGPLAERERSAFGQLYHVMMLGGMMIEFTVLPTPDLKGLNRKQIAEKVGNMVSEKYMELKDKHATK
ncbi:MAG: 1-acyl-sn-glycerol-3-phosphate acyltransferase [Alphaproteobacteria bacterium]|nr:1-acyl-sn-glycerol-3-phosphate acyltransferase [Alphaproteobacteria bacterium]